MINRWNKEWAVTQDRLKQLLHYDPDTGVFTWLAPSCPQSRIVVGAVAGCRVPKGYMQVTVDGERHKAHRLAWLYMTGEWPPEEVDHRNGVRSDNRWANLRAADKSLNQQNQRRARADNQVGLLGVRTRAGKFYATIKHSGRQWWLGTFATAAEASAAYLDAKRKHHAGNTI